QVAAFRAGPVQCGRRRRDVGDLEAAAVAEHVQDVRRGFRIVFHQEDPAGRLRLADAAHRVMPGACALRSIGPLIPLSSGLLTICSYASAVTSVPPSAGAPVAWSGRKRLIVMPQPSVLDTRNPAACSSA